MSPENSYMFKTIFTQISSDQLSFIKSSDSMINLLTV